MRTKLNFERKGSLFPRKIYLPRMTSVTAVCTVNGKQVGEGFVICPTKLLILVQISFFFKSDNSTDGENRVHRRKNKRQTRLLNFPPLFIFLSSFWFSGNLGKMAIYGRYLVSGFLVVMLRENFS